MNYSIVIYHGMQEYDSELMNGVPTIALATSPLARTIFLFDRFQITIGMLFCLKLVDFLLCSKFMYDTIWINNGIFFSLNSLAVIFGMLCYEKIFQEKCLFLSSNDEWRTAMRLYMKSGASEMDWVKNIWYLLPMIRYINSFSRFVCRHAAYISDLLWVFVRLLSRMCCYWKCF